MLAGETDNELFEELVAHLRDARARLRGEWAQRIRDARLLTAISADEICRETTALYDKYVAVLETGSVRDLQAYARDLSERLIQRGVETRDVLGIVLRLRDVLARSLFQKYRRDFVLLNRVFDVYEPAANRIANTVAVSFVEQRERVIRRQQKAIQVLRVQDEERKRISRELHDEVGQAVVAINANLAASQSQSPADHDALLRTKIADVEKLLLGAVERVHSFARELRPAVLDELGLVAALRSYLKEYAERTGLLVHLRRSAGDALLTAEQKTALFRVAQESLSNVAKHAQATEVEISVRSTKTSIELRVRDNGRGFPLAQPRCGTERLGLPGMQERVRLMRGRLLVRSAPGAGTTIVAQVPLQTAAQSPAPEAAS